MISGYYNTSRIAKRVEEGNHRQAVGGRWEELGRLQHDYLVSRGLRPEMTLVDIGCGSLRAGIHLVEYLDSENYFGTDINESLLDAGYDQELSATLRAKLPRSHLIADGDFDFHRLPKPVDWALAQSVFTHLPLNHIRLCLARLAHAMRTGGHFYATFFECPPDLPIETPLNHEGSVVTQPAADPYHYYRSDLEFAAAGLSWQLEYIGEWGHPRSQKMICFHRL